METFLNYTDEELETLLDDIESDLVEKKPSLKGEVPKRIQQAICAFANDLPDNNRPGIIFVGANDDGTPSGMPITENLLSTLARYKTNGNILPLPAMNVQKKKLKGKDMAVITVMPSDIPPVKYDGRICVRAAGGYAPANEQEERILIEKKKSKYVRFDISPVPLAKLDDLAENFFLHQYLPTAFAPDVVEENQRTYEQRLAVCKMIVSVDDPIPTVLGLLTIGKQPMDFIGGNWVQFLRIAGAELSDSVVDEEKITGTLGDIIRRCEEKLAAHNRRAYDIKSAGPHTITIDYPAEAVRQIIINAVLHRNYEGTNSPIRFYWYDDKIEVINPGAPYGGVTKETLGKPGHTDCRNLNIATVLKNLGHIEQFGVGIDMARKALKRNGNPPLEHEVEGDFVTFILRKGEKK